MVLFSPLNPHWPYSVLFYPRWSYSVHFVHFVLFAPSCLLWIYLVLFGPYWSYSVHFVHFGSILSTSVLFSLHWFYSVQYVHFGPIQSYSVHLIPIRSYSIHLVQFGPIGSLRFILVHLDLFLCTYIMGKDMFGLKAPNLNPKLLKYLYKSQSRNIWNLKHKIYCCYVFLSYIDIAFQSTLVLFSLFCPLWFYSVSSVHFGPIQSNTSTSVLFNLIWSSSVYSFPLGPIWSTLGSIRSYSVHLVHSDYVGSFWST